MNIYILLRVLYYYGIAEDIIRKIIIQWDIICRKPQENYLRTCLSEICNPFLLTNGGTRWDYRTDFYHKGWKQKKRNGKFRWKKKRWEVWHQNPSRWAPYYKLHPEQEKKSNNLLSCNLYYTWHCSYYYPLVMDKPYYYCKHSYLHLQFISNTDTFGNVKSKILISPFNYSDKYIHSEAIKIIDSRLSKYFDTSLIYKNADTNELLSFIFNNFVNFKSSKFF